MDEKFLVHVRALRPKLEQLLAMQPVSPTTLPKEMPRAGVYLLSEGGRHLYVGRSNDIRKRMARHSKPGATHRMAAFAFRLAREETGFVKASYKKGEGSRSGLMENPAFARSFKTAKERICRMNLRFVEEADPVRQGLLEVYVAVVLETPHNDFNNH